VELALWIMCTTQIWDLNKVIGAIVEGQTRVFDLVLKVILNAEFCFFSLVLKKIAVNEMKKLFISSFKGKFPLK
jgi:hypothetical protein